MSASLGYKYRLLNNVFLDPRALGFQAGLIPWIGQTSSPRVEMFSNHINQALVLEAGEFPHIFCGPEKNYGEYELSKTRRDQGIMVVKVIPKYPSILGQMQIRNNPSMTAIYVGRDDNKLNYMKIESHTRGSDGFGYENRFENADRFLEEGHYIPKEMRLVTSPIHKNGLYCPGINVNTAYMTLEDTIEDGMVVSESFAEMLETTEIHTVNIPIFPDYYPLNLYGDDSGVKAFPDIGESVNESGFLCAFRCADSETFIPDTTQVSLNNIQIHDIAYYVSAPVGSRVIDININAARSTKMPKSLYEQADKYIHASNRYWKEVVSTYNQYRKTYDPAPAFIEHVSTAIQRLIAAGIPVDLPGVHRRPKVKLIAKNGRPIEFMEISITYATKRKCAPGFKITGRDGEKGVISRIIPDADMPVDDQGVRAGLVIDPNAHIARMTFGPLYEPAINRVSEFVRRRLEAIFQNDPKLAVATFLDYVNDVNPNQVEAIRASHSTEKDLEDLVQESIKTHIHLWVPCGLNTIGMELIHKLKTKWDVPISPVTFTQRDMDGNLIGTFRTKKPVLIGSKYLLLLGKIPEPSSACVAHISQYETPMKPRPSDRDRYPIRTSPIRFIGEDEGRIIAMDLADPLELRRLMDLQGRSRKGVDMLCETILNSDYPTRIDRIPISTKDLAKSTAVNGVFNHMLSTMGVGTSTKGPVPLLTDVEER